jgi:hypothetical protein
MTSRFDDLLTFMSVLETGSVAFATTPLIAPYLLARQMGVEARGWSLASASF